MQKNRAKSSGARMVILLAAALTACVWLQTGCTSKAGPSDQAPQSTTPTLSWAQILQQMPQLSPDELNAQLKAVHSAGDTPEPIRQKSAYVWGRILQAKGTPDQQKEAVPLFTEAANLPPLWERCQWHIAECAAATGQEKTARQALESIMERSELPLSRAGAQYGLAQSYLRANEPQRARATFEQVAANYPGTQFALGSAYYLGEMDLAAPDRQKEALSLLRTYLRASPDGHFAQEIVNRLVCLPDYQPTNEDHDLFAQVYYVQGDWQVALAQWMKSNLDKHWYERAVCLFHLNQTSAARAALSDGIKSHPTDSHVPAAAQMLCRMLSRDQAIQVWENIKAAGTKYGDIAIWNIALRSPPARSLDCYRQIVQQFPHSTYASESLWWIIWDRVKQGRNQEALKSLDAALKQYPRAKIAGRFAFWQGKLHERMKHPELAHQSYSRAAASFPSNYYGYRAQARLSALSGGKDPGWSTSPHRSYPDLNWNWPNLSLNSHEIQQHCGPTVSMLAELRQWDECLQLLPPQAGATFKAWILANLGLPLDAINTASRGLTGPPQKNSRWQFAYPLLYANLIASEAKAGAVDPLLVHALIREESRYNQLAVSHSNAIGLMQLLPGTAYGVAKHVGTSLSGASDIYKPEVNLKLGTQYLAHTTNRFGGRALLAVASYNGGPNAVQSWAQSATDYDTFVENIPFQETRDYVRKVFGSYWTYQKIYAAPKGVKTSH